MSSVDPKKLEGFVTMLCSACPDEILFSACEFVPTMLEPTDPVLHELVFSMFLWESSLSHAIGAMNSIREHLADYNELRVCFPSELSAIIGTRYPRSLERSERLIETMNHVFQIEQGLTLARLQELPKRDARQYLTELRGIPGFVAARVTLIAIGGHAFPVDGLLAKYLTQEGVLGKSGSQTQQMSALERAVRAVDARKIYGMVEYWADKKRNSSSRLGEIDTPAAG